MKIVCKTSNRNEFTDEGVEERLRKHIRSPGGETDLEVGKEYVVYGVVFWDNAPCYYICLEAKDTYPVPYPADYFDVIDDRLSSCWELSFEPSRNGRAASSLVFHEWAEAPRFYERLIEGDPASEKLFQEYRDRMDFE
jgi:hypothetical protein